MANEVAPNQKIETLKQLFEKSKGAFAGVLPKHLSVSKMLQIAIAAAQRNPGLLDCTPGSLIGAMLTASELGLEVGGARKEAWLVPFNNSRTGKKEATFIPDYRGIMELVRRTGKVTNIWGSCVWEGDIFDYDLGSDPYLKHKRSGEDDPKKLTHAYVCFKGKDGTTQFWVMDKAQIEKRRNVSQAWRAYERAIRDNKPATANMWVDWTEEMWLKTVIKRGSVFMPQSTELSRAIELDNRYEDGSVEIDFIEIPSLTEPEQKPQEKKAEPAQEPQKEAKSTQTAMETPKTPENPPVGQPAPANEEKLTFHQKVSAILEELCPGDQAKQADLLESESAYDAEDHHVNGKRSVEELTEGRAKQTYLKLKTLKTKNAPTKA